MIYIRLVSTTVAFALLTTPSCRNKEVSIEPLKHFASTFNPGKTGNCTGMPAVPDDVTYVLENREIDFEYKKYVVICMIKLYDCQLHNHHQGYEIRDRSFHFFGEEKNSLINAFCKFSKMCGGELVTTDIVLDWLEKNKNFKEEKDICGRLDSIQVRHEQLVEMWKLTESMNEVQTDSVQVK